MKIKKEIRPSLTKIPPMKVRYSLMVPLVGITDMLTMASFYFNPVNADRPLAKGFFLLFALVGAVFTLWGLIWCTTVDGKLIRVRSLFGKHGVTQFAHLKKVVVRKKKRNGVIAYYKLIDKSDQEIVRFYPIMKNSGELLERLKLHGVKVEEEEV